MAVTKIIPIHATIGKSIDYICNPNKTENCAYVHSENCFPQTASVEFDFYLRHAQAGGNTLSRHLIQSFSPGEVTAEQAHEIGKKLAENHLKGEYAYVMTTHVDRAHIHNHFVWCAVNVKTHKRYRSNHGSYREIQGLSDKLCREYGLSVIETRSGRRGKNYAKYQEGVRKLYDLESDKFKQSPGLARWGKTQNLKIMAETVNLLRAKGLMDLEEFERKYAETDTAFDEARTKLKTTEQRITELTEVQKQLRIYGRTKELYLGFQQSRNKDKFIRQNEGAERDVMLHEMAKRELSAYKKAHGVNPSSKEIKEKLATLRQEKATLYEQYKMAKSEQSEMVKLRINLQKMLDKELCSIKPPTKGKNMERGGAI